MIEKILKDLINKIIYEIKKNDNKIFIEKEILCPLFSIVSQYIFPYILLLFLFNFIIFILIIVIIIIILNKKNI